MNSNISDVGTTKMTSKGQVVIPEEIREYMKLETGVKFLVMATSDDSIIFKKIHPIPKEDIKALLEKSHKIAKEYGITEEDIQQDIAEVRKMRKIRKSNPRATKVKKAAIKKTKGKNRE